MCSFSAKHDQIEYLISLLTNARMNKSVQWFLVSNCGLSVPLPQTMISLGRDGCDVVLQSRSVDKRHAVITYDHHEKRFKVKDLNSINGTYLNSVRIPSQAFVKLEHLDSLRFAFDAAIYQVQVVERIPQFAVSPYDYQSRQPLWNTHPYAQNQMKMAECQGCLYKQTIQHTCGMKGGGAEKQPPNPHCHQPQHVQQMASQSLDLSLQNYSHQNAQDLCGNIIAMNTCSPPPVAPPPESPIAAPQVKPGGYVTEVAPKSNSVDMNGGCHGHGACSPGYHYPPQAQVPLQCSCQNPSNSYRQSASSSPMAPPYVGTEDAGFQSRQSGVASMQSSVTQSELKGSSFCGHDSREAHGDAARPQSGAAGSPTSIDLMSGAKRGAVAAQGIISVMEAEKPYSQTSNDAACDNACQSTTSPTNVSSPANASSMFNQSAASPVANAAIQATDEGKSDVASFPSCTAFTVDFTDDRPHNKRLDIRDSISKFAPPKSDSEPKMGHRRNHSLPKDEEYKVVDYLSDENGNSDGNKSSPSSTPVREGKKESEFAIGTTLSAAKARLLATAKGMRGGYRSEGHVSSDQEDELSSKSDPTMNPKGNTKVQVAPLVKPAKNSHEFSPLETPGSRRSLPVTGLRDSAKYLISKMFGEVVAPPASPTDPPSPLYLPLTSSTAKNAPGHHDKQHPKSGGNSGPQVEFPLTKNDGKSGSRSSLTSNTTYTVDGREFGNSHTLPRAKARPTDLSFAKDGTKYGWVEEALSEGEDSDVDDEAPTAVNNGTGDVEEEEDGSCENASEAGTYTIEKDDKGEEETEARRNIDTVFGVTGDYSVQKVMPAGDEDDDVVCGDAEEPVELRPKNVKPAPTDARIQSTVTRKGNSSWLKEWVTQSASSAAGDSSSTPSPPNLEANLWRTKAVNLVGYTNMPAAQYQRTPETGSGVVGGASDGDKSAETNTQRPRRKLPVLPVDKVPMAPSPGGRVAPTPPVANAHDSFTNERSAASNTALNPSDTQRKSSSSSRTSPEGRRSDSSMDTETILRDTETVVTAMEARMDNRRKMDSATHRIASSSLESRDSGGESDNEDTSAASGGGTRQSLNKRLSDQLKMQLRHLEQDAGGHRRATGRTNGVDVPEILLPTDHHHHLRQQRGKASPISGGDHADNLSELETASLHSDVSTGSDLSGSSPGGSGKRKGWASSDGGNAPLMRLNRAFSLRRARLGCDGDLPAAASSPKAAAPSHKLPAPSPGPPSSSRPSSAGSVSSNRDRGWRSSTSNRSDSGASAASGGRSAPPPTASNDSFSRSDGGRFSLRLPRSAPIPVRPQSAKISQHHPVAPPRKNAGSKLLAAAKPGLASSTARSNSTMSAKELEMKNWKRRKTYDPLKAAAEGRRKEAVKKVGGVLGGTMHGSLMSKSESPSPTTSHFQRSASFHGSDGLTNRRNTFSLHNDEDEDTEEFSDDNQLTPNHGRNANGAVYDSTTKNPHDNIPDDVFGIHRGKKSSENEFVSEASRTYSHTDLTSESYSNSPRGSPMLPSGHGHKSKADALDNLVISTIHQLSNNLRTNAELVLKKLSDVHSLECEETVGSDGVQELMRRMNLSESPVSSPQVPGVSRQLSGILKNMKCLEESLQVVSKVLSTVPTTDAHRCPSNCNNDVKRRTGENASLHVAKNKSAQKKWNGFKSSDYY